MLSVFLFIDLAVANYLSNKVSILLNNPATPGVFNIAITDYDCGISPVGLDLQDLNGDGFEDIIAASYGSAAVFVMDGKADGTFEPARPFPTLNPNTVYVVCGDLNEDGVLGKQVFLI